MELGTEYGSAVLVVVVVVMIKVEKRIITLMKLFPTTTDNVVVLDRCPTNERCSGARRDEKWKITGALRP